MAWTQTDALDEAWTVHNAPSGIFDGATFDMDIFDGIETFERQASPDPNWTRAN